MRFVIRCIGVWLLSSVSAMAQTSPPGGGRPVDVGRAMDQKLEKVSISSKELPEALTDLGKLVGIKIDVDEASADLLPWGAQTKLSDVTISNASLREALPQILGRIGMTYEHREGRLLVVATNPLKRINRRATWEELGLLQRCCDTVYSTESFAQFRVQYRITRKVDAPGLLRQQLEKAGRGTIAQLLEVAAGSLGWVWFPDQDRIVIRTAEAQVANQLSRRVTARYERMPLSRILLDLSDRAEVPLLLEPGIMLRLPASAQSYTLVLSGTSIRQALNVISADTGLKYEMRRDVLYIGLAEDFQPTTGPATTTAPAGGAAPRRSTYVGRITIPSEDGRFSYDFLVREEDLPPDVLEYRRQVIKQYIEQIRRDMAPDEAGEPAGNSQP
jgi:hypothetical protein